MVVERQNKETSIDAQGGVKIFPHLILLSQIMQDDILGELQLDENIIMILPRVLLCPLSSILSLFHF